MHIPMISCKPEYSNKCLHVYKTYQLTFKYIFVLTTVKKITYQKIKIWYKNISQHKNVMKKTGKFTMHFFVC